MSLYKVFFSLCLSLIFTVSLPAKSAQSITPVTIVQTIKDGVGKYDGLDNPRQIKLSKDRNTAYVLSGDDNALSVFNINHKQALSQSYLVKSNKQAGIYLEGASSLAVLDDSNRLAVVSFYNGALTLFAQNDIQPLTPLTVISDHLAPTLVFKSTDSLADKDNFGLLGAWDIAKSRDENSCLLPVTKVTR